MSFFSKKIAKVKKMQAAINPAIQESIQRNDLLLIDQQTDGQFDKGQDQQGMQFVPSYADSTKAIKRSKGQPTNRVTLLDTGDLYASLTIKANTTQAIISANVAYFTYLVGHYKQNQILGIQDPAMREFIKRYTFPILKKKWSDILSK